MTFAVRVRGLSYVYPDGTPALRGADLDVPTGARVGLVGPNGAGKSTLLLHLNGLLRGTGVVEVFGEELNGRNLAAVRRRVGLVFQDPDDMLFMPTLYNDVAFGPRNLGLAPAEVETRARAALTAVGLAAFGKRSPHHLSVGEKKRAALACVLALGPDVLLLDEPTANLDGRQRRALAEVLKPLSATMVVASHDLAFVAAVCEEVAVMADGRILTRAPAAALRDERFSADFGLA